MTIPIERYNSLKYARFFLEDLLDPKKTPGVPKKIRLEANNVLRHYPGDYYLDLLATKSPEILHTSNTIDELSLLIHNYETKKNENPQT